MPRFEYYAEDILLCNTSSLRAYEGPESQESDRPTKRLRLDDDIEPIDNAASRAESLILLWDFELVIHTDDLEVDLSRYEGLSCDGFSIEYSQGRDKTKRLIVHTILGLDEENPLLTLKSHTGSDGTYELTKCLPALGVDRSSFYKRLEHVYGEIRISRQLYIKNCQIILHFKAEVYPLHDWTPSSVKLANDKLYRFLVNSQYPDELCHPATVSTFYAAINPPPPTTKCWSNIPELKTELMQYQKNAVDWMIDRENGSNEQPNLWIPYFQSTGKVVYLQKSLGLISKNEAVVMDPKSKLFGGLLSDEMGLGKTLEVIATLIKNRRPGFDAQIKRDTFTGNDVRPISATLIVTPNAILPQWLKEVEKHSNLKAYHYYGMRWISEADIPDLALYDIVITDYTTLADDIHHAAPALSKRKLRKPSVYEKRKSQLIRYEFWRVILDEAQQIQSGTSAAAQVAAQIPRVLAWAVTGTPISKSCMDSYGLLHFLRISPFYANSSLWGRLLQSKTSAVHVAALFNPISCRNTKALVSQELMLPPQTRYLCQVNFTPLEEQNFSDLLTSALQDLGLDRSGEPLMGDWNTIDFGKLQSWLSQLRVACSYPQHEIRGIRLSSTDPIRSLDEVLLTMLESTRRVLEVDRRSLCSCLLLKGQIKEYQKEKESALDIWQRVLVDLREAVEVREITLRATKKSLSTFDSSDSASFESIFLEKKHQNAILDLRYWRQILHKCLFFLGSIHFQLDDPEEEAKYDLEVSSAATTDYHRHYALAKDVRKLLLSETESKALHKMTWLKTTASTGKFVTIPEMKSPGQSGGVHTRDLLERIQILSELMNEQADQLDKWRKLCIERLSAALADQNDDPTGEEFQQSLDLQEEAYSYHELIRFTVSDRNELILGTTNNLLQSDVQKVTNEENDENMGTILKDGMAIRAKLVAKRGLGNLNMAKGQLGNKIQTIEGSLLSGRDKHVLTLELEVAKKAMQQLEHQYTAQKVAIDELNKEVEQFSSIYNARLEYYRQFQAISDDVQEFTVLKRSGRATVGQNLDDALARALGKQKQFEIDENDITDDERARRVNEALSKIDCDMARLTKSIDKGLTRKRYLKYLGDDQSKNSASCSICMNQIEIGVFTICGHIFCQDCFHQWFHDHRECPICKRVLHSEESYQRITLKPQEEGTISVAKSNPERIPQMANIDLHSVYHLLDDNVRASIGSQEIVKSFSSKIDSIVRHILSLPHGTQSIVYSSSSDVIHMVSHAILGNNIQYLVHHRSSRSKMTAATFVHNPEIKVLLLSGTSHSAGLTLVNATNLFLVEPLLSPAVEKQIVSRIHRIGQTKPTSVFQYCVSGTLEETLLQHSVLRQVKEGQSRPEHVQDVDTNDVRATDNIPTKSSELPTREEAIMLMKGNLRGQREDEVFFEA